MTSRGAGGLLDLMPKIDTTRWTDIPGGATWPSDRDLGPLSEIPLGDQVGLTQFGARLERLPPGSASAHRHWHDAEDELVYVISGEVVLIEEEETVLRAGEAAGWKAGEPVGHCLENRSEADAVLLVIGTRSERGTVIYPDLDVVMSYEGEERTFALSDGTPLTSPE